VCMWHLSRAMCVFEICAFVFYAWMRMHSIMRVCNVLYMCMGQVATECILRVHW